MIASKDVSTLIESSHNTLSKIHEIKDCDIETKNSYVNSISNNTIQNDPLDPELPCETSNSGGEKIDAGWYGPGSTYISNAEYFMSGPCHGQNKTGTCSAVAIQLLLSYNNYYNDRRIIASNYLFDDEDGPNTCANPMRMTHETLGTRGLRENGSDDPNSYFHKIIEKIPASSSIFKQINGINTLLNEREEELGLNTDLAQISFGFKSSDIKKEIDANRPVGISFVYNDHSSHAVVGYGYQTLGGTGTEDDGQFGYIVHYGWSTPDEDWTHMINAWINKDWCRSWIKMEVNHTHSYGTVSGPYYERQCTVCGHRISDFPFTTVVNNGEVAITRAEFDIPSDFAIPTKINNYPVTTIYPNVFSEHISIVNLKIPNSIETIGAGAFSGCTGLKSITLPFTGNSREATSNNACFGYIFGTSSYPNCSATNQNGITYYIPLQLRNVTLTDSSSIKANSFQNCNMLTKIKLPYGTTNIESYAFSGCTNIRDFIIPRTVTSIGSYAFNYFSTNSSIVIPYNVSNISPNAFSTNIEIEWIYNPLYTAADLGLTTLLKSVIVENGVETVEENAFTNCINLNSVTIGENVNSIDNNAFTGCTILDFIWNYNSAYKASELGTTFCNLLTEVSVENGTTNVKEQSFNNCINLRYITLSENVSTVETNAFTGCSSLLTVKWIYNPDYTAADLGIQNILTTVSINDSINGDKVDTIGSNAFSGCNKLKNVYFNEYIQYINDYAFKDCVSLFYLSIPDTVISIGSNVFENCSYLYSVTLSTDLETIGSSAFKNCNKISYIYIHNSVTYIGSNAFENCSNINNVTLSTDLETIGSSAFKNCDKIPYIYMPNSVTTIGSSAFENCTGLTSITLSTHLETIGSSAFKNCDKITSINMPNSVTYIGSSAFENCTELTSITLSTDLETIGSSAFKNCDKITSINMSNNVTIIDSSAFENCTGLTSITLSTDLETIGSSAFKNCDKITSINMFNNVTTIGSSAFENCTSLISIIVSTSLTSIGSSAFKNCDEITSISIPNSVAIIGSSAFENCSNLTAFTLPTDLTSIGSLAFKNCRYISNITLSNKVQFIGDYAFQDCLDLTSIVIQKETTNLTDFGEDVFAGCCSITSVTVPINRHPEYLVEECMAELADCMVPDSYNYSEYNISNTANTNFITNIAVGYNKLYKLNISNADTYDIMATSNNSIKIKLYDEDMVLLAIHAGEITRNITRALSIGTYYYSVEYNDISQSGYINTTINKYVPHTHNYTYTWVDLYQHRANCTCGSVDLQGHAVAGSSPNLGQNATCLQCGGPAKFGFVWSLRTNNGNTPITTTNGSYILSNGVIVLVDEDISSYMNGSLSFITSNINNMSNNEIVVYNPKDDEEDIY